MADGPDIFARLRDSGFGQGGKSDGPDDGTNSKNTIEALFDNADKVILTAPKLTGIPIDLSNPGASIKTLESEGIAEKKPPGLLSMVDSKGGFLANLLHNIFVKNREISDHTQGIGGSGHGEGGGSGGEGGSASTGGNFDGGSFADFSSLAAAQSSYSWADVPTIPEGGYKPHGGPGQSQQIELG